MVVRIAFSGKMGVGKSEACEYLRATMGGTVLYFAEPIYKIQNYAQEVCGLSPFKDRHFLQLIGTEWGRGRDPDIWVRLLLQKARQEEHAHSHLYLSDLRFQNELEQLQREGWTCVRIQRDLQTNHTSSSFHAHASEIDLDRVPASRWDHVLVNNGSLDHFHLQLRALFRQLETRE